MKDDQRVGHRNLEATSGVLLSPGRASRRFASAVRLLDLQDWGAEPASRLFSLTSHTRRQNKPTPQKSLFFSKSATPNLILSTTNPPPPIHLGPTVDFGHRRQPLPYYTTTLAVDSGALQPLERYPLHEAVYRRLLEGEPEITIRLPSARLRQQTFPTPLVSSIHRLAA